MIRRRKAASSPGDGAVSIGGNAEAPITTNYIGVQILDLGSTDVASTGASTIAAEGRVDGGLGNLMDGSFNPFVLGVHHSVDDTGGELTTLPLYVSRAHDERLRAIMNGDSTRSGMIVLVGDSSTGKSRALWEAIRQMPDHWRLWQPIDARELNEGLASGAVAAHTVVWLNDAHNFLDQDVVRTELAEDNAAKLRGLIGNPHSEPILIVATLWHRNWQYLSAQPQFNTTHVSELMGIAECLVVPAAFEGDDLAALRSAANHDPRLARALEHSSDGRITQYLAGAQILLERYATAVPEVKALIDAAIDARRLGHGGRLPKQLLIEAAAGYIRDENWDQLGDDWATDALRIACADWRGLDGPLTLTRSRKNERDEGDPVYRLADVLEQVGTSARRFLIPPPEFWIAVARHCAVSDQMAIGDAAYKRGRYRDAATLYSVAARGGDLTALRRIALIQLESGDAQSAERTASRAADSGDRGEALWALANSRLHLSDPEQERLSQLAVEAGNLKAISARARRFGSMGDYKAAERLAMAAADLGDGGHLLRSVAVEVADKEPDWAQSLSQLAADAGTSLASALLAELRDRAGDHEGADEIAIHAARSQDFRPLRGLMRLRHENGDLIRAESSAVAAVRFGNEGDILAELAEKRGKAGDPASAERLAMRAYDAGYPGSLLRILARQREDAGDHEEAKRLAFKAAAISDYFGLSGLAYIWKESGKRQDAERLWLTIGAADQGRALWELAWLREDVGDRQGAVELAQKAAHSGNTDAMKALAELREEEGSQEEAEHFAIAAFEAHDLGRTLGRLLAMRTRAGDRIGAERLYNIVARLCDARDLNLMASREREVGNYETAGRLYQLGIEAGDVYSVDELALLREEAGDYSEAERLYRMSADSGMHSGVWHLSRLWYAQGRQTESERLERYGLDAAGNLAEPWTLHASS